MYLPNLFYLFFMYVCVCTHAFACMCQGKLAWLSAQFGVVNSLLPSCGFQVLN